MNQNLKLNLLTKENYDPYGLGLPKQEYSTIEIRSAKAIKQLQNQIMQQIVGIEEKQLVQNNRILINSRYESTIQPHYYRTLKQITKQLQQKINYIRENQMAPIQKQLHVLALTNILVLTHGLSDFRLVTAQFKLASVLYKQQCYELCLQHANVAHKKCKRFNQMKNIRFYSSFILTLLAQCRIQRMQQEQALDCALRAHQIQQGFNGMGDNIATFIVLSQCYLSANNYTLSLQFITKAIDLTAAIYGANGVQTTLIKVAKAHIYAQAYRKSKQLQKSDTKKQSYHSIAINQYAFAQFNKKTTTSRQQGSIELAIDLVNEAISQMKKKNTNEIHIIQFLLYVAEFYQQLNDHDNQLKNLMQVKRRIGQKFGQNSIQSIKICRMLCKLYIKNGNYYEAISQTHQILGKQTILEGQNSPIVLQTHRQLGQLYFEVNQEEEGTMHILKSIKSSTLLKSNAEKIYPKNAKGNINKDISAGRLKLIAKQ